MYELLNFLTISRGKPKEFKNIPYVFKKDDSSFIHQLRMSSGEFLLIGLLDYINNRIEYNKRLNNEDESIIILDEIELALHPSAQSRLIEFLNKISNEYNFCIYFSTHSIEILRKIMPNKIFHIERRLSGKLQVKNPCYPAYAARSLYREDGFDYLILVEDELAKYIVKNIIDQNNELDKHKLIYILPSGGWQETIKTHCDFYNSKLAGNTCNIITILDGDIESNYNKKRKEDHSFQDMCKDLTISFLPILSVEKFLYKNLIINPNDAFFDEVSRLYNVRALDDVIKDYKNKTEVDKDSKGKVLFMVLKKCAADAGVSESVFIVKLCEIIYKHIDSSDKRKIEGFLRGQLKCISSR